MANESLENAFAEVLDDCQAIATKALANAAKKAQKDIMIEADKYLQKYYAQYKPKKYKRTKQLQKAITPIFNDKLSNGGGFIEIGVKYDPTPLMDLYRSNSWYHQSGNHWIGREDNDFDFDSQNNGIPEASWILDNFIEGIHPRTRRSLNGNGGYTYIPKQFSGTSTNTLMTKFFKTQLPNRINRYFAEELFDVIANKL